MFVIVAGGGKVGSNVRPQPDGERATRSTLIEQRPFRFERLEAEFEHRAIRGDATELYVLERAGIERPPDVVVAVTGDDEDNIVICQVARERYGVEKVIARVNNPKNQEHFDFLGISPTVSAVSSVLAMIEHEVPEHGLVHLLELRTEDLEIVEVQVDEQLAVRRQEASRSSVCPTAPPSSPSCARAGPRGPTRPSSSPRATRCSPC